MSKSSNWNVESTSIRHRFDLLFLTGIVLQSSRLVKRFHVFINYIRGLDVHAFSLIVQKQVPQPRFSCPLMYMIASSSNIVAIIRHFALLYGTTRKRKIYWILSKVPWYGTRKNVMCENSFLFQHCYFFDDKSLTINSCRSTDWYDHDEQFLKTVLYSNFSSPFKVLNTSWPCNLHNHAHYVEQRTILDYIIVWWGKRRSFSR